MMRLNHILLVLFIALAAISVTITQSGCANMSPPMGGPRDTLPPVLLSVAPADSSLNFNAKKILINFDEYIELDNIQKNLLVNPTPKTSPTVERKLKTITVSIRDTLEKNTTYTLDFGRAIKDLNEGNPFPNYRYIFSTGRTIDSLSVAGRVTVAETGKYDSTLIVLLYNKLDDSAVVKEQSRYAAKVDSTGYFRFRNLAPGEFRIYALKDEGARRYMNKQELFAFGDSLIVSSEERADISLYAYSEKDTTKKDEPAAAEGGRQLSGRAARALPLQTNASQGDLDLLSNLEFSFPGAPLKFFDSAHVVLTDTAFVPLDNYSFRRDTSGKKVTLVHPWQENTIYKVLIDSSFAEDTLGRKLLKNDTLSFTTKKTSDYGSLRLRFRNLDLSLNPVLQFIQNDAVKQSHVFTNNIFYAKLFPPGEFELRILLDENKNGVWDTGQFFGEKRQPEKVLRIREKITIRANWDNERDVDL